MMNKIILTIMIAASCQDMRAQTSDRDYIRLGNAAFRQEAYNKAEVYYTKAIAKKESAEAYFNLGNALAMQRQDSTAYQKYMQSLELVGGNNLKKAKIFHNMGNLQYASKNFKDAVELYKSSLRCNPADNETRYNLAMALHMLKNNPDNGGGGGGNNEQQDKKEQQDKQQQQQQKEQQQKEQEQKQQQQQKQNQQNMSEEAAEQLLNSAQQDEKNVQQKVKQKQGGQPRRLLKDW